MNFKASILTAIAAHSSFGTAQASEVNASVPQCQLGECFRGSCSDSAQAYQESEQDARGGERCLKLTDGELSEGELKYRSGCLWGRLIRIGMYNAMYRFMYSSALLIDPFALLQVLSVAGDLVVAAECAVKGVK